MFVSRVLTDQFSSCNTTRPNAFAVAFSEQMCQVASTGSFSEFHIDKTEYGDYTAIKQQLRRFLDEVYMYKRIHSTLG